MGRVAEEKFGSGSEAADGDVSAADGFKEGRVGRRAERAGDVGGEGSVFEIKFFFFICFFWGTPNRVLAGTK